MSKKIKCIRQDGTEVWLNEHVALNRNRQRQMGFMPMDDPGSDDKWNELKPAAAASEPEEEASEETIEIKEDHSDVTASGSNIPTVTNGQSGEFPEAEPAEPEETSEASTPSMRWTLQQMREAYKEATGKFPPVNWKKKQLIKKINDVREGK